MAKTSVWLYIFLYLPVFLLSFLFVSFFFLFFSSPFHFLFFSFFFFFLSSHFPFLFFSFFFFFLSIFLSFIPMWRNRLPASTSLWDLADFPHSTFCKSLGRRQFYFHAKEFPTILPSRLQPFPRQPKENCTP